MLDAYLQNYANVLVEILTIAGGITIPIDDAILSSLK